MPEHQSVKLQIVEILRSVGYDMFTAADIAATVVLEFLASPETEKTYRVLDKAFVLRKLTLV